MQASIKRDIQPGVRYNHLMPRSKGKDTVIVEPGKAQLHHTINLIRSLVHETKNDTRKLASVLKGKSLEETCRNIWQFVYNHIQYRKDQPGIEQVRRPARTWADRQRGVDCDCYTVFISSILLNLAIPHRIRITKYGGKRHFQHIYPVVPTPAGGITLDCVTDAFDYEVPYTEKRDFDMQECTPTEEIMGFPANQVSGVDSLDLLDHTLGITLLKQPNLSLREIQTDRTETKASSQRLTIKPISTIAPRLTVKKLTNAVSMTEDHTTTPSATGRETITTTTIEKSHAHLWWKMLIAAGAGYGAYRLLGNKNK